MNEWKNGWMIFIKRSKSLFFQGKLNLRITIIHNHSTGTIIHPISKRSHTPDNASVL
jgi:hypothetical protein